MTRTLLTLFAFSVAAVAYLGYEGYVLRERVDRLESVAAQADQRAQRAADSAIQDAVDEASTSMNAQLVRLRSDLSQAMPDLSAELTELSQEQRRQANDIVTLTNVAQELFEAQDASSVRNGTADLLVNQELAQLQSCLRDLLDGVDPNFSNDCRSVR